MSLLSRYCAGSVAAALLACTVNSAEELHWWERGVSRTISVSTGFAGPDKFEPAELAERKAALGFNAERLTIFGRHQGMDDQGFFFVSSLAGKTNADYLKLYLAEDKRKGLHSAVFFDVRHYSAAFGEAHPDWMQRNEDGSMPKIYNTGISPCVNSPYREWVFQILRDLAKYPIDGVFFDGPIFFPESCYCEHCKRKWAAQNPGTPMPSKKVRAGGAAARLLDFQSHSLSDFLHDARMALKANNPELLLYMNSGVRGANWASARMNRVLVDQQDILGSEGGFLSGDLTRMSLWKPGLTARLLERQAGGKPTQIFTAVSHKPWTFSLLPGPELGLCFFDALANGASCSFAFTPDDLNQPETQKVATLNEYLARNERFYMGTHSEARTALVWSDVTANFYAGAAAQMIDIDRIAARSEIGNLDGEFNGMADALVRSHTPFDVVDDVALERESLARYKTIVLPNAACLSDAVAMRLTNWVKNGGTLVATFETGLYNQTGLRRTDFALADAMGVRAVGKIAGPMLHDYMKPLANHNANLRTRALVEATTYHVAIRCEGAKTEMQFMKPLAGRYDGLPELSDDPALVEHPYGAGRVIYFSGDLGNSIQTFHLAEHVELLRPWFVSPVKLLNAPGSVEVVVRSQAAGTRWLVHLVNATGEMTRPIRNIMPIYDIRIQLPPERKLRKVTAVRSGQQLKAGPTVVLPMLQDYELLVIE
jgi:hypothetical protein